METKIFYLPRNEYSIYAIQQVSISIPCSFPTFEEMIVADAIKFKVTCLSYHLSTVEAILKRYGVI